METPNESRSVTQWPPQHYRTTSYLQRGQAHRYTPLLRCGCDCPCERVSRDGTACAWCRNGQHAEEQSLLYPFTLQEIVYMAGFVALMIAAAVVIVHGRA